MNGSVADPDPDPCKSTFLDIHITLSKNSPDPDSKKTGPDSQNAFSFGKDSQTSESIS